MERLPQADAGMMLIPYALRHVFPEGVRHGESQSRNHRLRQY